LTEKLPYKSANFRFLQIVHERFLRLPEAMQLMLTDASTNKGKDAAAQMGQKSGPGKEPAEQVVKPIRRATRRQFSAEEKIRIVLSGLRGEDSIAELCRREGIVENLYYRWSKWVTSARRRREDRSPISPHPPADLGRERCSSMSLSTRRAPLGPVPRFCRLRRAVLLENLDTKGAQSSRLALARKRMGSV
jgi:transposase-like protein